MLRSLAAAVLVVCAAPVFAEIQVDIVQLPLDPDLIARERAVPAATMPIDPLVFDKTNLRDPAQQRALLASIAEWLTREFDLPRATELPRIAFATPSDLVRRRYRLIRSDTTQSSYEMPAQSAVARTVAIYDDSEKAIYLPESWRGDSAADVSVVVHEMVHHLQNIGHMHFTCARAREASAYEAQEKWLQIYGRSLREDFDVDPFTVLVSAMCL
jgi:hypothetical protein